MKIVELESGWYRVKSRDYSFIGWAFFVLITIGLFPFWKWYLGGDLKVWQATALGIGGTFLSFILLRLGMETRDLNPTLWKRRRSLLGHPSSNQIFDLPARPLKIGSYKIKGGIYLYLTDQAESQKIWINFSRSEIEIEETKNWLQTYFSRA
jgi:hypothetical protein